MRFASLIWLSAVCALAQDGRELFVKHCAVCHGDGRGSERGPNLVTNRRVRSRSIEDLRRVIREGMPATGMPAYTQLPDAEINALAAAVRSLSAPAADTQVPGDRAAGEQFFHSKGGCANCHMALGRGKAVGPDLSSAGREMTVDEIEESIRKPGAKIKTGYQVANVRLKTGANLRGFVRNENRYSLQLQDLNGRFHLLTKAEVAESRNEPTALMPEARCTPAECRDLVAYVSSLSGVKAGAKATPFPSQGGPSFAEVAKPKPADWPMYHGQIGGSRHSALDQITTANVKDLELKWVFPMNHYVVQATPVVVDGVMYVSGPNQVFALDARAGRTIWHYQRSRGDGVRGDPAKGTNRGVAVLGDRVFVVTDNAHLLALHRVTGQLLWDVDMPAGLDRKNIGNTAAPLVVNDMVVAGVSGGDLGMRGFLTAYKADTGEQVWRTFTVPAPGEPLAETSWKGTALAQYGGGGATWMTGTFDPETNTVFWGTGNPYPAYNGDQRQGDNLYTGSVVAFDAASGRIKWHYQFTPHDLWDWDGGQTPVVINAQFKGRERKLLLNANRNGFFYVFDRTNGELLLAEKFVDRLTWAKGIGKDGRPILIPGSEPTREGTKTCPSVLGAANWPSVAFNPATKLFYVQSREACGIYVKDGGFNPRPIPLEPGQMVLRALDIETGKRVWEVPQMGPADSWGGVLSTAGGVLFYCEDSGVFAAVDAKTGKEAWSIQVNASAEQGDGHSWRSSPMTFMAGGKQYVAVANGPNILCFGLR